MVSDLKTFPHKRCKIASKIFFFFSANFALLAGCFWYWCYYLPRSRDALSPVCGIFIIYKCLMYKEHSLAYIQGRVKTKNTLCCPRNRVSCCAIHCLDNYINSYLLWKFILLRSCSVCLNYSNLIFKIKYTSMSFLFRLKFRIMVSINIYPIGHVKGKFKIRSEL